MPRTSGFAERIGKVFLPEADAVTAAEDFTPNPDDPGPGPGIPFPGGPTDPPFRWPIDPVLRYKFCWTRLKAGCYTLGFRPAGSPLLGTRYRGTLRVESVSKGYRISGDLYTYRLLDDIIIRPTRAIGLAEQIRDAVPADEVAADSAGMIPIYRRNRYHSYLKGTGARLFRLVPRGTECSFSLDFDQFVYNHPATGFSGTFNNTPTRSMRFILKATTTPDLYSGEAYDGATLLGTVSIRWISDRYRRAHVQLNTLQGADAPPASVATSTFSTIFQDAGWELTVTDGGTIPLPAALAGVNINNCWASNDLHALMTSAPGYNAADLDTVWRVHLVAVPAKLGCSRGVMFDHAGGDPNAIAREGSATFSRDGYPASEAPDGMGGSHYDGAAGSQQRNVPRAFLRSATHEVGHAFNQIHQNFEGGSDNSLMTPTNAVASTIGTGGTFPDDINLAFNATVKKHLLHLPDPAVRPGAMNFFGSAVSAPEAADVAWLDDVVATTLNLSADRVSLGEPVTLTVDLTNRGQMPVPVPEQIDMPSLTLRVNVSDPTGRITFLRPPSITSCPNLAMRQLEPGQSTTATATVFWGTDGFAFEQPGRHVVEAIVMWDIAGVPVAVSAEREVFVSFPVSDTDNKVAALLLHPEVGRAVATGKAWMFEEGANRIREAAKLAKGHPAAKALAATAVMSKPARTSPTKQPPPPGIKATSPKGSGKGRRKRGGGRK